MERKEEMEKEKVVEEEKESPLSEMTEEEYREFDALIGSYLDGISQHEIDSIVSVPIVEVHRDHVLVDLGDKAEGVISVDEFRDSRGYINVTVGDLVDVLIMGREEETGLITVSSRLARQRLAWQRLEEAQRSRLPVTGKITRIVGKNAGVLVDIGIECFMPSSQIGERRISNLEEWIGKEVDALILDIDNRRRRVVLSRRQLIEENKRSALEKALASLEEGTTIHATVRTVQNFGIFLNSDEIEVFMPREEVSWETGSAPGTYVHAGSNLKVKVIQIDRETGRVRVSRKALKKDPWETAVKKYKEGEHVQGEIVSITRYGAFVRLEEGLTGMIHVSDLTWGKGQQRVEDHVKEGDTARAVVLAVDSEKRRMSLGLKQMVEDPWVEAERQFPKGSKVKATVTSLATFGAFVRLTDEIEGLIHISDFSWEGNVKHPHDMVSIGQEVEALVLKTDRNTRRISLGLKQLTESPATRFCRENRVGSIVEGEVVRMIANGVFVSLAPRIDGFMHISQIGEERIDKPESVLKVGEKVRCKITRIDRDGDKIALSRKELIQQEQAQAIKRFKADPKSKGVMKLGELFEKALGASKRSDSE
ncbi:S1 RNA-binding domain-containing protein [Candidatus Sumerlaeota bacterium]|nr:S1 RNA-binding domain-containing protein [Candidatus Sumerlaeota bacterium]